VRARGAGGRSQDDIKVCLEEMTYKARLRGGDWYNMWLGHRYVVSGMCVPLRAREVQDRVQGVGVRVGGGREQQQAHLADVKLALLVKGLGQL